MEEVTALLTGGRIVLWFLILCSLASFTLFIERFTFFRRMQSGSRHLMVDLKTLIREKKFSEAIHLCEKLRTPLSMLLEAVLERRRESREEMERAVENVGTIAIFRLERNVKGLSIIAHISPLLGLLGTVLGFIQAFGEMQRTGMMDISVTRIGESMQYALVTTALGLIVAIPSIVAYHYLAGRVAGFLLQMQTAASELIDLIKSAQNSECS